MSSACHLRMSAPRISGEHLVLVASWKDPLKHSLKDFLKDFFKLIMKDSLTSTRYSPEILGPEILGPDILR